MDVIRKLTKNAKSKYFLLPGFIFFITLIETPNLNLY